MRLSGTVAIVCGAAVAQRLALEGAQVLACGVPLPPQAGALYCDVTDDAQAHAAVDVALAALTRSAARAYGPRGIRASVLCPGWVDTPMAAREMAEMAQQLGIGEAEARAHGRAHGAARGDGRGARRLIGLFVVDRRQLAEHADQVVERRVEALDELAADVRLDRLVHRFDLRRHCVRERAAARGEADAHAALVVCEALALHEAQVVHACEYAGEAGTGDAADLADLARLQRPALEQRAHDAPLLLGHPVRVQDRPEMRDHALACVQQQQRQVAMREVRRATRRRGLSS
jgi:hypothetical protein